jgi:hypothetical protein
MGEQQITVIYTQQRVTPRRITGVLVFFAHRLALNDRQSVNTGLAVGKHDGIVVFYASDETSLAVRKKTGNAIKPTAVLGSRLNSSTLVWLLISSRVLSLVVYI